MDEFRINNKVKNSHETDNLMANVQLNYFSMVKACLGVQEHLLPALFAYLNNCSKDM